MQYLEKFCTIFPQKIFSPDNSLIFSKIDISLTVVKILDTSAFYRQAVTLNANVTQK